MFELLDPPVQASDELHRRVEETEALRKDLDTWRREADLMRATMAAVNAKSKAALSSELESVRRGAAELKVDLERSECRNAELQAKLHARWDGGEGLWPRSALCAHHQQHSGWQDTLHPSCRADIIQGLQARLARSERSSDLLKLELQELRRASAIQDEGLARSGKDAEAAAALCTELESRGEEVVRLRAALDAKEEELGLSRCALEASERDASALRALLCTVGYTIGFEAEQQRRSQQERSPVGVAEAGTQVNADLNTVSQALQFVFVDQQQHLPAGMIEERDTPSLLVRDGKAAEAIIPGRAAASEQGAPVAPLSGCPVTPPHSATNSLQAEASIDTSLASLLGSSEAADICIVEHLSCDDGSMVHQDAAKEAEEAEKEWTETPLGLALFRAQHVMDSADLALYRKALPVLEENSNVRVRTSASASEKAAMQQQQQEQQEGESAAETGVSEPSGGSRARMQEWSRGLRASQQRHISEEACKVAETMAAIESQHVAAATSPRSLRPAREGGSLAGSMSAASATVTYVVHGSCTSAVAATPVVRGTKVRSIISACFSRDLHWSASPTRSP